MSERVEKHYALRALDFFRGFTPEEMAMVDSMTRMVEYKKGHLLYSFKDSGEVLFLLKKGTVELYRLSLEGRKLVLASLGPDTVFGEMALVGQRLYDTFAEVAQDSTVCVVTRKDMEHLLAAKPELALRLLAAMGQRLSEAEGVLEEVSFKGVRSRVASLILRLGHRYEGQLVLEMGHQEVAERISAFRETVTSALNELEDLELVELARRRITVRDEEGLQRLAES